MKITIRHVSDCANLDEAERRVAQAVEQTGIQAQIHVELISTLQEAENNGFAGSPSILIDGEDPFDDASSPSLACRLYRTAEGFEGAPSVAELVAAIIERNHVSTKGSMTDQLDAVRRAIATNPTFEGGDRRVVVTVYEALANGETPTLSSIADRVGRSLDHVAATIERCNVFFDGEAIAAFGGLSTTPTAHSFEVRGRRLYTWCAWDPLFIARILREEATVRSACPVTGEAISMVVGPSGVRDITPDSAVLSMKVPDESCSTDLVANFCGSVLLFASREAAESWTGDHAGTFVVSLDEALELADTVVRKRTG